MNILEARRRTLGKGVYKKTVEGNPAIAQGSLARRYPGITMQGWTEQAQYKGKNLFEIPDITAEISDTKIECNITQPITISATNEATVSTKIWRFRANYKDGTYGYAADVDSSLVKTFDASEENPIIGIVYRGAYITSGAYRNVQIEYGESATAYEPYTGGKPSPSPDYPQEIVSAGKYNEGTGKWEYEITIANAQTDPDKNQTVTLTADRPLTKWDRLEKRNGQWGWVYKSAEVVLDGGNDEAWTLYTTSTAEVISFYTTLYGGIGAMKSSLCDKYINKDYAWNEESLYGIYSDNIGYPGRKYFRPPSADVETVEQWKTWLQSNSLTLWYETAEETFVPLSESEQEQMNELYTFRPTTVLSNDCECEMTLTYKTKKSLEVTT